MSEQTIDRYCVFGNPIAHSKSPIIHSLFAEQTQQQLSYDKQLVELDGFNQAAKDFFANGGKGLNITVPFKHDAYQFAQVLTERAKTAGAVNTLALQEDGSILGDNTDGIGMVSDIVDRMSWPIQAQRVLILGAGGAVRGVLLPVLEQHPMSVTVANRTAEKARVLEEEFKPYGQVNGCGYDELDGQQFDLVINGTSASLSGDLPPIPAEVLASNARAYDMMYGSEPTPFLRWAKQHGAKGIADGLGMLVGQAAESFYIWRRCRPNVQPVIDELRQL